MKSKARLFALLAVLPLLPFGGPVQAAEAADPYNGQSPYKVINGRACATNGRVVATQEIVRGDTVYGTIQVRRNLSCNTSWAFVNFGGKLGAGEYGNALIRRSGPHGTHRLAYSCDTANGNKRVLPGQSTCYTPMMTRNYSMWAEGYLYHKNSAGSWVTYAFGKADHYFR
ncbi:DUF2690 domain-containing protein [Streptosporangium sp. NPDC000396]|uniref:DUF2690 domain-containing protein n=1 Tax=Streptosporangium sp. NPDC000396 TaxID=3366185 RepID=UPI0036A66257